MRSIATVTAVLSSAAAATASDFQWPADKKGKEPLAQRTVVPKHPVVRKPGPVPLSWLARPAVNSHYCLGYVGGDSLRKGHGPGPLDGTIGMDYVGFGRWPQRLFLKFGGDSKHTSGFFGAYEQDGPRLPGDPIAAAPFKKAIREAKAEHHEKHSGASGGHE